MTIVYVWIVVREGDLGLITALFGLAMLVGSLSAALAQPLPRRRLLGLAAGMFLSVGILGILSIGFPFLVAGFLALVGRDRMKHLPGPEALGSK